MPRGGDTTFVQGPSADLVAACDLGGAGSGPSLVVHSNGGTVSGATALWWNKDGVGINTSLQQTGGSYVTPSGGSTTPYVVVVQVDNLTSVSTFTATEWYDPSSDTCHFTGQVVTTNG